ncbi:hypothetical protein BS78_09G202700 [Paspalum vaginatum]|nr:hypothetical protein BS78_09G202700 [Paspalum vaginatum]
MRWAQVMGWGHWPLPVCPARSAPLPRGREVAQCNS